MEQAQVRTRQRRKEARPGEILAAAFEEFSLTGFAATRLDDVAARAGITKGTIYVYFPDKEDLFVAAIRETFRPTMENIAELAGAPEGPAMDILRTHFRFAYDHIVRDRRGPELVRRLVAEAGRFPDLVERGHDEVIGPLSDKLAGVVRYGIDRGEFRDVPMEGPIHLMTAPVMNAATWRTRFGAGHAIELDAYVEGHLDMLGRFLLKPSKPAKRRGRNGVSWRLRLSRR